jgi:hypothetical protein
MLATTAVVYTIGMPDRALPLRDLLLNLAMVQQFLGAEHLDGSYWTLQVELFFYAQMLLWFVLGALTRMRWIILAWLVLAVVYGGSMQHHLHFSYTVRELFIVRHIPFFAMGILSYQLYRGSERPVLDVALIGLCLLAVAIALPPVFVVVGLVCCAIFGLFLVGALRWLATPTFRLPRDAVVFDLSPAPGDWFRPDPPAGGSRAAQHRGGLAGSRRGPVAGGTAGASGRTAGHARDPSRLAAKASRATAGSGRTLIRPLGAQATVPGTSDAAPAWLDPKVRSRPRATPIRGRHPSTPSAALPSKLASGRKDRTR